MWSLIPGPVKAALAAFGAILSAFFFGHLRGKAKQRERAKAKAHAARLRNIEEAREQADEIENLDDSDYRRQLNERLSGKR